MSIPIRQAILVRVTTDAVVHGTPATSLWIVATDDPKQAVTAVGKCVPLGWAIKATDVDVLAETMQRLGLEPGYARQV